ncbi:MAG: HTTM domain-containing protein [Balneolaceae bacterium]|nr:HTTM domain-containing protein [Balneolaceae bacterium]
MSSIMSGTGMRSRAKALRERAGRFFLKPVSIAPLVVFRVLFGALMLAGTLRFAWKGWIRDLYITPEYFFRYYGFEWLPVPGDPAIYGLFLLMGLSALGIMLGYRYRWSALLFFLSFTWVELIDKTNYLNHYYFVSLVSFLLILVPAHRSFSLDVRRRPSLKRASVPAWCVHIFKLQLGIVYVHAGLAKLNADWLMEALPLKLWLPARAHLPLIGGWLDETVTAYLFSWGGALYDLSIPFLLLYGRTRAFAYAAVVLFHGMTALLFQIGMFPYIMTGCTLIFFSPAFHERLLGVMRAAGRKLAFRRGGGGKAARSLSGAGFSRDPVEGSAGVRTTLRGGLLHAALVIFFMLQLLVPHRHLLYPGNVFWNEEGYRFSWRVMLMEKAGHAVFHVRDPDTGREWQVSNYEFLTPNQEKMMATQPDMILQFAHYLEDHYRSEGYGDVAVSVEARVTLNGRRSSLLVDPGVDLTEKERGLAHKEWILPYPRNAQSWMGGRKQ